MATGRARTTDAIRSVTRAPTYYRAVSTTVYQSVTGVRTIGELTFLIGAFQRSWSLIGSILLAMA